LNMELVVKNTLTIDCAKSSDSTKLEEPLSATKLNLKAILSSNVQASFTLFKSFIGTGILALPYAFKTAGVGLSTIVLAVIGLMLTHCFLLLLKTADDKVGSRKISFPKLAREILGTKGQYFLQALLMVEQLGCCIGIIIFTKNFLNHVVCAFEAEALCDNTAFNLAFSLGLTVPLSLINNMHYFYIPSFAANFFIMIGLISQLFYTSEAVSQDPTVKETAVSNMFAFNFMSLPLFFGVACFSFEGVGLTFSIRDSMEKPQDLPKLLKSQMFTLTTIYIIFSSVCSIALGNKLQDIVFFSLPAHDPFYLLIQILYAVSALFTYPIQLFPALRIIEESDMIKSRIFTEKGKTKNATLRYGLRLSVIGIVFVIAYTAKSFHLFLGLLGSCVFTLLGFVMPICLYNVQFKDRMDRRTKFFNYVILIFIISFGAIGFFTSFIGLISE